MRRTPLAVLYTRTWEFAFYDRRAYNRFIDKCGNAIERANAIDGAVVHKAYHKARLAHTVLESVPGYKGRLRIING